MRRMFCAVFVCVGAVVGSGCSDYRDQDNAGQRAGSSSRDTANLVDEVRGLKREVEDFRRDYDDSFSRALDRKFEDLAVAIADAQRLVGIVDKKIESQGETITNVDTRTNELEGLKEDSTKLNHTVDTLKSAVDGLKTTLSAVDLDKFLEVSRDLADMTGKAIKAEAQRDGAQQLLDTANKTIESLNTEISKKSTRIVELSGRDISDHPDFIELKKKLDALNEANTDLQKDYDQMKGLADAQAEEIRKLKAGEPVIPDTPTPSLGYEAGFKGTVSSSKFVPDIKQYVIMVDLKEGETPKKGEVLVLLDDDDKIICEFKVTRTWGGDQFGGQSTDANISDAPSKGHIVRRKRSASAGGVDE